MKKILISIIFLFSISARAMECKTNEILIASCNLSGKTSSYAAICAHKDSHEIYYVFQKKSTPELVVNFSKNKKLSRWVDLGTYTTYFGFKQGSYSYIIGIPEERPGAVAFMDIKKDGVKISSIDCNSNSFGDKNIKSISIKDISDDFVRSNRFEFP